MRSPGVPPQESQKVNIIQMQHLNLMLLDCTLLVTINNFWEIHTPLLGEQPSHCMEQNLTNTNASSRNHT